MIAAIYARKRTEHSGISEEQKSITRQIEHAKAYAEGPEKSIDRIEKRREVFELAGQKRI